MKTNMMNGTVERRRRWARGALASALAATLALSGCAGGTYDDNAAENGGPTGEGGAAANTETVDWDALIDIAGMDFDYSDRDKDASYDAASATKIVLSGAGATIEGDGASADGSTVTITAAGTYVVSGELTDGALVVNATDQDKVQVVLDGATIRHGDGAAFEVQQADKVFVTLAEGSQSTLADGATYTLADGEDEPNAALFSKDDLTINGSGALTVEGNYRHGVNSKDDLVIAGGTLTVTAKEDGLRGKDCVKIADGSLTVTAGGDGVKSNNDEDPTRGFVSIDGGTFAMDVQDDGVQAATYLRITGGEGTVKAADHALRSEVEAAMTGGSFTVEAGGKGMNPETRFTMDGGTLNVTGSDEGIEAEKVIVNDGELNIVATDDGINAAVAERSDESAEAAGGAAGSGDVAADQGGQQLEDGQRTDGQAPEPPEGFDPQSGERPEIPEDFDPSQLPEGDAPAMPEGERPEMPEGAEEGQAPQRPEGGPGAEDGMPQGGRGGMGAGGPVAANASEECLIQINGGKVTVDAGGDGLDSNGYVEVNGGVVLASGSTGGGDSALDYEYGATITGGAVILAGATGMAETFTEGAQPFAMVAAEGSAGTNLAVTDEAGTVLVSYTVPKAFQCAVVSAPGLTEGATGKVVVGGAVAGADSAGYATDAMVEGGTTVDFTASTTPSNEVGRMGDGGRRGGPRGDAVRGGQTRQGAAAQSPQPEVVA
ncbi:hypothetical protein C811_01445 [Adlercreutzia caecimuris B7]|uniref:Carbohydrate-binding domain-containing protein n=2 Tax=Adlercreutzia caecimuris TaxID=671266 RepID=R9L5I8_9ACTN|nr:hypothetical protein C811_01445 [Adlercreutzia caecimuris B7]